MTILTGTVQTVPTQVLTQIRSNPIIQLVQTMIEFDPKNRPTFSEIRSALNLLPNIPSQINLSLPRSAQPGFQSLQLSFGMESLSIIQKSIQLSTQVHQSIVSGLIHDQKESHLCWAFATSTVIRAELKRLVTILDQNGIFDSQEIDIILKNIDQMNKENRLMYEVICLVTPRSPKLENFFGIPSLLQTSAPNKGLGRLCYDGVIRVGMYTRFSGSTGTR